MAPPLNLHNFKLLRNISPRGALDIGLALSGHRRETDLVRYLALAVVYASWKLDESTLAQYQALLASLPCDSSTQLLDLLSFPLTFAMRGEQDSLPGEVVRHAQRTVQGLCGQLLAKDFDVVRLHRRAQSLLQATLGADENSQRMVVAELQVILLVRSNDSPAHPERSLLDDLQGHRSVPLSNDAIRFPSRAFATPAEALSFILRNASFSHVQVTAASPGGPAIAGAAALPPPADSASPPPEQQGKPGAQLRVFKSTDAFSVLQKLPPPSPHEGNNQQRRVLEIMSADIGWRALTETPLGDPLAELYGRFPHFKPVLDFVARYLALAACGDAGRPARIAPMLLRGAPGTGKTYFAQELARALGTHFVERDLAVISEAFVISGMDPSWKGSKPGIVFEALVNGKTANPVICLNEVDKARVTGTHSSPLAALYALLEPTSAERFVDEFIPVNLDASGVIWVLTANDGSIPDPILSRLEVFEVPLPTQEQCRAIAESVWASICLKSLPAGHGFAEKLAPELLTAVSALSPRVMRRVLTRAVGEAAFAGRKVLERSDLDAANSLATPATRSIGFLA